MVLKLLISFMLCVLIAWYIQYLSSIPLGFNLFVCVWFLKLIFLSTEFAFSCAPGETDLQCVPEKFESVEEYVRVFEPLLFEECRAQLYSTWEELTEGVSRDAHMMVRVRSIERRERGAEPNSQFMDTPQYKF